MKDVKDDKDANNKRKRLTNDEYIAIRNSIDKDYFIDFYLHNCNDNICKEFNIRLSTIGRLLKDFDFKINEQQFKEKCRIATEQRCLAILGVKNPYQDKQVKDKIKHTNLERYGVENVFASEDIKCKIKQTNLDKYGVEYNMQRQDVRDKAKQTCMQLYGVDNYAKSSEFLEKSNSTKMQKYGKINIGQFGSEEHAKSIYTKYGVQYVSQSDEIKQRIKHTNLERYGVEWFSQCQQHQQQLKSQYTFNNILFDSLPELAVYIYCVDHNITIYRPNIKFEYYVQNKKHYYFPDFIIDNALVEIKGDHFFDSDGHMCNPFDHSYDELYEAKHQCGLQNNVQFWTSSDYDKHLKYFNQHYNKFDFMINIQR